MLWPYVQYGQTMPTVSIAVQAHLLPPSGATCQKASGKSTSQFGEDLVSLPEGNSSSLALGSSSVTAPPSLVDSRSTTTVVQSPPNTTTPVKALKQLSTSIHSTPRPAESTCMPHKEARVSSLSELGVPEDESMERETI